MKRRKALSLLLSLAIVLSLVVPATSAFAADGDTNEGETKTSGLELSKTAHYDEKTGTYTITLEAYATGSKVISEVTMDVPTDIILVLDQSGSMANDIGTVSFEKYEDEYDWWNDSTTYHTRNQNYYEYRHNGGSSNLWHKLDDDSYVSVSVTKQEQLSYSKITNGYNEQGGKNRTNLYSNRNNLYAMVNGEYVKVSVERTGTNYYTYTYKLADGTVIATSTGTNGQPKFQDAQGKTIEIYLATVINANQTVYTYTYTDSNNNVQTIGTSTGASTVFSPALYKRVESTSGGGTRLQALKNAVISFGNAVHTKSLGKDGQAGGGDDVDHRIALVGFSSSGYNNTELLTGSAINQGEWHGTSISTGGWGGYYYFPTGYEMNGPQYGSISDAQYKAALLPMDTDAGLSGVITGANALTAYGGTRTDNGLAMANKIFEQNPIPTGEKRNRVVIVFTDGIPGQSGYDGGVDSSAIAESKTAKETYGATVYAIGIFSGADATSAGSLNTNSEADIGNNFLQRLSSNNGTPQSPSYYLSAADAGSLNSIFQQISDKIEDGGTSSTLTEESVVKDIISPQFTLPAGTTAENITLETYACTGKDANGDYTWSNNNSTMGATATINGDQVNVTGFNFSDNYVGTVTENGSTTYRGNKLVISFKVQPKAGFLGGNDVYTNDGAGIYENDKAEKPLLEFNKPTVNVPIKDVTDITAPDKNVYLLGSVTLAELQKGATAKVGDVELKLDQSNFGLKDWQTQYVKISATYTDKDGNVLTNRADLKDDVEYTVTVTVKPKTETPTSDQGVTAVKKDGSATGHINVFKPVLTYKDSEVYYGADAPDFNDNLEKTEWKHGETIANPETMIGTEPTLGMTYKPEDGKINSLNKIDTKEDIGVDVAVTVNGNEVESSLITFVHQDCAEEGKDSEIGNYEFLLHVKTCTLTITKTGGADNESYVFDVFYKDGKKYSEVAIWGNTSQVIYELPVGTYTIAEDGGWSWRYDGDNGGNGGNGVTLSAEAPNGTITCTNTHNDNKLWLNGFSEIVRNIFGQASTPATDANN